MGEVWITAIMQTGAMAIMAYHFLVGLPAMMERYAKDQQAERMFWAAEAQRDREAFSTRAELIAAEIRQSFARVRDQHGNSGDGDATRIQRTP
jgi:hypothetical protein